MPDVRMPEDIEEVVMPNELVPEFSGNVDYRQASELHLFSGPSAQRARPGSVSSKNGR
jgi:hypothetical protein